MGIKPFNTTIAGTLLYFRLHHDIKKKSLRDREHYFTNMAITLH